MKMKFSWLSVILKGEIYYNKRKKKRESEKTQEISDKKADILWKSKPEVAYQKPLQGFNNNTD